MGFKTASKNQQRAVNHSSHKSKTSKSVFSSLGGMTKRERGEHKRAKAVREKLEAREAMFELEERFDEAVQTFAKRVLRARAYSKKNPKVPKLLKKRLEGVNRVKWAMDFTNAETALKYYQKCRREGVPFEEAKLFPQPLYIEQPGRTDRDRELQAFAKKLLRSMAYSANRPKTPKVLKAELTNLDRAKWVLEAFMNAEEALEYYQRHKENGLLIYEVDLFPDPLILEEDWFSLV